MRANPAPFRDQPSCTYRNRPSARTQLVAIAAVSRVIPGAPLNFAISHYVSPTLIEIAALFLFRAFQVNQALRKAKL